MVPAVASALFFGHFLGDRQSAGVTVLAACSQQRVKKCHGGSVGSADRSGFDAGEETFLADAGKWRNEGVRDGYAVSAVIECLACSFNRLT